MEQIDRIGVVNRCSVAGIFKTAKAVGETNCGREQNDKNISYI